MGMISLNGSYWPLNFPFAPITNFIINKYWNIKIYLRNILISMQWMRFLAQNLMLCYKELNFMICNKSELPQNSKRSCFKWQFYAKICEKFNSYSQLVKLSEKISSPNPVSNLSIKFQMFVADFLLKASQSIKGSEDFRLGAPPHIIQNSIEIS